MLLYNEPHTREPDSVNYSLAAQNRDEEFVYKIKRLGDAHGELTKMVGQYLRELSIDIDAPTVWAADAAHTVKVMMDDFKHDVLDSWAFQFECDLIDGRDA